MTAPVVVEGGAAPSTSGRSMTFLLPSKYKSVAEAPAPANPAVELGVAPAGRCEAVATYAGNLDMDAAPEKAAQLLDALEKDAVQVTGEYTVCGYNPPFTLPWFKRNEIHVPVDPDSIAELCPPPESEGVAA
ncbi:unnamed protein product [Chondrus crispus]|uniref:SOUL heme-binding protein n=1 Tax=Chondrus crispus TaxID=2769 RepID=R7QB48_CHOCR|nr:unnamed protein product [Chondrus crispus]CDF35299.1 unnamed protein product [Chondrus crispus]|eukprot:XP_005715118.1 unnamed protein product [Chondrus crispus]